MSSPTAIDWTAGPPQQTPAFVTGFRSIVALMLREMGSRFGRKPGGYLWVFLQPLGLIVVMAVVWAMLERRPRIGNSFLMYIATGFLIVGMFKQISQLVGHGLSYSRALLEYPGVSWIDPLMARFLLNALMGLIVAILTLYGIMIYENLNIVVDLPKVAMAFGLTLMLAFGIGCLNCVLFMRFPIWANIWSLMTAPLAIASGVLRLYEQWPPLAQQILWYNPVLHVVGLSRDGFFVQYTPSYPSVTYVVAWSLIPMTLGLLLLRRHRRALLER